ncbi:F-box/kelch-repeat protein At1g57790-like [Silene latifolia]|uniref:F-box/kelch-repeat protein At1g57790-like n=1 Tax=Silene latifolia TaxID=37657 RepID=UPI003D775C6B
MKHADDMNEETDMKMSTTTSISQLPADILQSIANCVHLFDYMNLRATCKTLRSTIPTAKWRFGCSFPLFMSIKNNKGICELRDPCQDITHTVNTPHSPSNIEFCKDGWLLLRTEGGTLQYFNPFTGDKGTYPSFDGAVLQASYAFSTCPDSSDCITVGITGYIETYISCFQASSKTWDSVCFADTVFTANYNSSPKYHNGAFYFIGLKGNLGVFEIVEGECSWKVYDCPLTEEASLSLNSCYLVELDGELVSVFIQQVGKKVQVFKFEISKECWVELTDLGDHVLFLSPASSFSESVKDSTMRNRIYLPRRIGNGIVYYSLKTRKYHTLGKDDPMDDLYGTWTQSFCCWI